MKTKIFAVLFMGAVLISACGGKDTAQVVPEPAAVEAEPVVVEQAPADEQPAPAEPESAPAEPAAEAPQPAASAASGMMEYAAMESLFKLEVPNGWAYTKDTEVIDNTVVETFTAPDGNAFVQVVVNESGINVSNVEKGQITLDFMKRLYGSDLRVATDVTMDDGRERLEWWSDQNKISGTTYFHRIKNYLFFYSTYYDDAFEKDYRSILKDVNDSYTAEEI